MVFLFVPYRLMFQRELHAWQRRLVRPAGTELARSVRRCEDIEIYKAISLSFCVGVKLDPALNTSGMNIGAFWVIALCSLEEADRRFRGAY
jgi:hypothetical protein